MKYIDAEKLKAEIEKRAKFHNDAMKACIGLDNIAITHSAGWKEDTELITIINSLQQEQPKGDLEKERIQLEAAYLQIIKEFIERGKRCEQQAVEDQDYENYIFWGGFRNCAENILREVEKSSEDWREKRKEECPFRRILDNNLYGCERYAGLVSECNGICSWVIDYPKLKEIQDKKEQKQPEGIKGNLEEIPSNVDLEKEIRKHTDLFQADIEYPLRLTAIKFYELGLNARKEE